MQFSEMFDDVRSVCNIQNMATPINLYELMKLCTHGDNFESIL